MCDPTTLSLLEQRYLKHGDDDNSILFYLPGVTKFTTLFDDAQNSRQIGFFPFATTWYRAVSVLAEAYQVRTLYFAAFQNAITISTKTKNASTCEFMLTFTVCICS